MNNINKSCNVKLIFKVAILYNNVFSSNLVYQNEDPNTKFKVNNDGNFSI